MIKSHKSTAGEVFLLRPTRVQEVVDGVASGAYQSGVLPIEDSVTGTFHNVRPPPHRRRGGRQGGGGGGGGGRRA